MPGTAIIFGGPSPEHEISVLTGLQCERVLTNSGESVIPIYWSRSGAFTLVPSGLEASDFAEGMPKDAEPLVFNVGTDGGFVRPGRVRSRPLTIDVVLNCCHGGPGESGPLNGLLEISGIPATGGPSWASALGMDKLAFYGFVSSLGIPCLPRANVNGEVPFPGPYIVKPRCGGSSLGIQVIKDLDSARAFARVNPWLRDGAVVEPYAEDISDLNLAFRTAPEIGFSLLERPVRSGTEFYDYEEKYLRGGGIHAAPRELPAKVPPEIAGRCVDFARSIILHGEFRGVGRMDFLYNEESNELYVNEINTIPGAMAFYLWPESTEYVDLLSSMLREALDHPVAAPRGGTAASEALRVASGISQKLSAERPTQD